MTSCVRADFVEPAATPELLLDSRILSLGTKRAGDTLDVPPAKYLIGWVDGCENLGTGALHILQ
jgi:hypothetical protein